MKVKMVPHIDSMRKGESGIHTVIRHYFRLLPEFGVQLVGQNDSDYDVAHTHAGNMTGISPGSRVVSSLHGMYWSAEYDAPLWERRMNAKLVECIRQSDAVTVPSDWVNETLMRDMHMRAHVIPHGINWDEWQHDHPDDGYVIAYAKNRAWSDVSIPTAANKMARMMPDINFVSTFSAGKEDNLHVTGPVSHDRMKRMVQGASVFVSPIKETFGIAALEAMASGVPVLTVDDGQVPDLVGHGVAGYCYQPGNFDDMVAGVRYCLENRKVLGDNARELARAWTWEAAVEKLVYVYQDAYHSRSQDIGVVIPVFNKSRSRLARAIDSVLNQTRKPRRIIVVDDGSDPVYMYGEICNDKGVEYIRQENKGVAHARNAGIAALDTAYVVCLDADDEVENQFMETCANELDINRSVYIAYTGITTVRADGESQSKWPGSYDYNAFLKRRNQVPTCCMFRRVVWQRLGGYRQRYAPTGAGSEDAEFFLRAGALGYGAKKVTERGMFRYTMGDGHTSKDGYREVDWTSWHTPWLRGIHPMASHAKPADGVSHPVRSYNKPLVSIVIAVGPGHEDYLVDALDSIEGQTLTDWEVVVVWDNGKSTEIGDAFPFIREVIRDGDKPWGAGRARNEGVRVSRAPFLVFLDADDWLHPEFLENVIAAWNNGEEEAVIYTDYTGVISVPDGHELLPRDAKKFLYNIGDLHFLSYEASDFDCEKAIIQPVGSNPYHWCSVTSLVPRAWHDDIGGFDETLDTWEDIDYWWRMARDGKCFARIPQRLFVYRLDGGKRREQGLQRRQQLLESLREKYKSIRRGDNMCGCQGGAATTNGSINGVSTGYGGISAMSSNINDDDLVMVQYVGTNRGQHPIRGQRTKNFYGYRSGGERFLMHRDDIATQPHLYRPVEGQQRPPVATAVTSERKAPSKPEPVEKVTVVEEKPGEDEVNIIPASPKTPINYEALGLQKRAINNLSEAGIVTYADVMSMGVNKDEVVGKLTQIRYVGEASAEAIYDLVSSL